MDKRIEKLPGPVTSLYSDKMVSHVCFDKGIYDQWIKELLEQIQDLAQWVDLDLSIEARKHKMKISHIQYELAEIIEMVEEIV